MYGYYGDTEQDVTFENCSNYANITSTHGYASVFLGCMMDGTIRFTNCKNYGKLVSLGSASMLIANPSYAKTAVVHVDDCANNGLIMCSNEASAYSLFGTLVENIFYANALTVNGVSAPITSYYVTNANFQTFLSNEAITSELTGNPITYQSGSVAIPVSDNKFVLNTTDGAAYYTLSFSFTAGNHAGGNAGYVLRFDSELPNDIMVGSWITKAEAETLGAEIVAHEAYGTTYYTCDGRYVFYEDGGTIRNNVSVSFIAYSSENTPLSIATYEYQG